MTRRVTIKPVLLEHAAVLEQLISDPTVAETTRNIPHPYPEGGAALTKEQRAAT